MRISDTLLERLNSQADLVSMIRKHTTLKPAGREFKGCCPFHGEKTPSFYVNPQTNLYYCFGCGVKGNPITFLREFERMTFQEATEYLADQTGIEIPKDNTYHAKIHYKKRVQTTTLPNSNTASHPIPQVSASHTTHAITNDTLVPIAQNHSYQEQEGDLYSLLAQINVYYQHMLHHTPTAKQYFLSRGLSEQTIDQFQLGYAPNDWQHLQKAFPQDIDGLKALGLVRTSQKGREFDLLRDRVVFPIKDRQGRVVGFAGRALGDDLPKYINSSESPVFQKHHILYGFFESRQAKANQYLLVEGYMDVIALHQAGIFGAVAPMGTAVNQQQLATLLKYNDTLTLCFDGDMAGQKAAWRALEIAAPVLEDGKHLKFLTLPNNHDPDTYIRAYGKQAMTDIISTAKSTSNYVFEALGHQYDLSKPENKAAAMATLKELTAKFPKGSSFKWWLNNDIYQKLRHNPYTRPKNRIPVNYTIHTDAAIDLCLCLLYNPYILQTAPLHKLLQISGVETAHHPYMQRLEHHQLAVPPLPTWHLLDTRIDELITTLTLLQDAGVIKEDTNPKAIDDRAHLIMASLSNTLFQTQLVQAWREFFYQVQHHNMVDISLLFNELLCQMVKTTLNKQQQSNTNLLIAEIYKRRLRYLNAWDNANKSSLAELLP